MIKPTQKTFLRALVYSAPVMLGYIAIGVAFGLLMADAGYPWQLSLAMSVFMYAGAGQYLAVGLFTGGAGLAEACLAELVVNARHMAYGLGMMKKFARTGPFKWYLVFALTDETFALLSSLPEEAGGEAGSGVRGAGPGERAAWDGDGAAAPRAPFPAPRAPFPAPRAPFPPPHSPPVPRSPLPVPPAPGDAGTDRSKFMFYVALLDQCYWIAGSAAGAAAGALLPFSFAGVSFALTALFLVLLIEQVRRVGKSPVFGISGAIALAATALLPARVSLLAAMALALAVCGKGVSGGKGQ